MSVVPVVDGYDLQRPFFSCRTDRGIGQVAEEYFFVLAECQEDELPVNISLISFQAAPRISYLEEEMMWIEVHLCDSRRGLIRRYVIDIRSRSRPVTQPSAYSPPQNDAGAAAPMLVRMAIYSFLGLRTMPAGLMLIRA